MLIVDASVLVAVADASSRSHDRCVRTLLAASRPLVVPALVLAEAAYLIGSRFGPRAEIEQVKRVDAGDFMVEPPLVSDWSRIVQLMETYRDLPLGAADASVVVLAERKDSVEIATLDRRHFSVVRPRHAPAFRLLPEI